MVDFSQVIPFWWALPIGLGFIFLLYLIGKVVPILKGMYNAASEGIRGIFALSEQSRMDRAREGVFWYISTLIQVLIFLLIIYVITNLISYFLFSPPDVTIFQIVLGDTTWATVGLVLLYRAFKTIPYLLPKGISTTMEEE